MASSVYIHIPFCRNICTYCDFCKLFLHDSWINKYLDALEKEVSDRYLDDKIKTIYIGGGTPSALEIKYLKKLFEIITKFSLEDEYEFTFECNLQDINEELLLFLKQNKVNRLSIGIQSFNQNNLKFMGREANYKDAYNKIQLCRKIGFLNINVDLIYALPYESIHILKKDLRLFNKLKVDHISTYSLMIEPNTYLSYQQIQPISEDIDAKMYKIICKYLKRKKYNHYEISNFSKANYYSKHNLTYWNNEEYYGFGLGASGYVMDIRYDNTKNLNTYLKGDYVNEKEILSLDEKMNYEIILGLRKTEGINVKKFYEKYHINIQNKYKINELLSSKDLIYKKGNIFINPDRLYVMNEILVKLV